MFGFKRSKKGTIKKRTVEVDVTELINLVELLGNKGKNALLQGMPELVKADTDKG